jgi:hypothetical protein
MNSDEYHFDLSLGGAGRLVRCSALFVPGTERGTINHRVLLPSGGQRSATPL